MTGPPGIQWGNLFLVRGEEWTTLLVEPKHCKLRGMHHLLGLTLFAKRQIRINVAQALDEIPRTVIHERMHAYAGSGRCENFIRTIEHDMWQMCFDHGFKLPPYPRGFWAMRERVLDEQGGNS